jgi:hypothetical protein
MPTSNASAQLRKVRQQVLDLCSGAWTELGVSGWGRTHQQWAIDPEPLIVFTAGIADQDPRLRDEAMDWCIRNWRHVSVARLRNILIEQDEEEIHEAWGRFAATVNRAAGVRWPSAATVAPPYRVTERSILRPLTEPSLVFLRMRAMFGLGARTEVLRFLLFNQERASAAALADATNYAKRNVSEACELLVQADVLQAKLVRNRFYYSLTSSDALEDFVGAVPAIVPDWNALFRVIRAILRLAEAAPGLSRDALVVETHQAAQQVEDDLDLLKIEAPDWVRGSAFLDVWEQWASSLTRDLASGKWPTKIEPTVVRLSSRSSAKRPARIAR